MDRSIKNAWSKGDRRKKGISKSILDLAELIPVQMSKGLVAPLEKLQVIDLAIKYLKHLQAHSNNSNHTSNGISSSSSSSSHGNSSYDAASCKAFCDKSNTDLKSSVERQQPPSQPVRKSDAVGICCEFMKLSEEERKKEYKKGFNESIKESIAYIRKSDVDTTIQNDFIYKLVNHLLKLLEDSNDLKLEDTISGSGDTSLRKRVPTRDKETQTIINQSLYTTVPDKRVQPQSSIMSSKGHLTLASMIDRPIVSSTVIAKDLGNTIRTNGEQCAAHAEIAARLKPICRPDSVIQNPVIHRKTIPIVPAPCAGPHAVRGGETPLRLIRRRSPCFPEDQLQQQHLENQKIWKQFSKSIPVVATSCATSNSTAMPAAAGQRSSCFRGNEQIERNDNQDQDSSAPASLVPSEASIIAPTCPSSSPGNRESTDQTGGGERDSSRANSGAPVVRQPNEVIKSSPPATAAASGTGSGTKSLSALQTLLTTPQTLSASGSQASSGFMESLSLPATRSCETVSKEIDFTLAGSQLTPPVVSQKRKSPSCDSESESFRSFKKKILQRFDTEGKVVPGAEDETSKNVRNWALEDGTVKTASVLSDTTGQSPEAKVNETNGNELLLDKGPCQTARPVQVETLVSAPVMSCLKAQLMQKSSPPTMTRVNGQSVYKPILPASYQQPKQQVRYQHPENPKVSLGQHDHIASNLSSLQSVSMTRMQQQAAASEPAMPSYAPTTRCTCSSDRCSTVLCNTNAPSKLPSPSLQQVTRGSPHSLIPSHSQTVSPLLKQVNQHPHQQLQQQQQYHPQQPHNLPTQHYHHQQQHQQQRYHMSQPQQPQQQHTQQQHTQQQISMQQQQQQRAQYYRGAVSQQQQYQHQQNMHKSMPSPHSSSSSSSSSSPSSSIKVSPIIHSQPSAISVRRNATATPSVSCDDRIRHSPLTHVQANVASYPTPPASSDRSQISSPFPYKQHQAVDNYSVQTMGPRVNQFYQQEMTQLQQQHAQQQQAYERSACHHSSSSSSYPQMIRYERPPDHQTVRAAGQRQMFDRVSPASSPASALPHQKAVQTAAAATNATTVFDARSYRYHPHVDLPVNPIPHHPAADLHGYLPPQFYISIKDPHPASASLIQID